MVVEFQFAFELVGNFVYSLGFVIKNYYIRLGNVLFAFVRFVYMVRKDLVDRTDLVDRCSCYCDDDLCYIDDFENHIPHLLCNVVDS